MPFDGLSHSREQITPPTANTPEAPAFTAQSKRPKTEGADLADPLAAARKGLEFAFTAAESGGNLSPDQVAIVRALRREPTMAKLQSALDEVVYRDPDSGAEYRARDYFQDSASSKRQLDDIAYAIRAYEAALSPPTLSDQYPRQWVTTEDASPFVVNNRADWREYNQRPEVVASLDAARERIANGTAWETPGWQAQLQADWSKYNEATTNHLRRIRESLERPMQGAAAFADIEARAKAPAPARAERVAPVPVQEIQVPDVALRSPSDFAGPKDTTVVMPDIPPAPAPARRINPFMQLATKFMSLFR